MALLWPLPVAVPVSWQTKDHLACARYHRFVFKHNMYKLREERDVKPATFSQMVSSTLYEKRCAAACPAQAVHRVRCQCLLCCHITECKPRPLCQVHQALGCV